MYYLLMIIVALFCYFNRQSKLSGYFIWGLLFFLSAFRGDYVGVDTLNAMNNVSRAYYQLDFNHSGSMEILTNFVYLLIDKGLPNRTIIFFYSIVTFVSLYFISKRWNINLSVFMLFFLLSGAYIYSFNIARQWAAIPVVIWGLSYVFEQNIIKSFLFFVFIIIASFIHYSSILYILLYGLRFINLNAKVATVIVIFALIFSTTGSLPVNELMSKYSFGSYSDSYFYNLQNSSERSFMGHVANILNAGVIIYIINSFKNYNNQILLLCTAFSMTILTQSLDSIIHRFFMVFMLMTVIPVSIYFSKMNFNKLIFVGYLLYGLYVFQRGILDEYYLMF